MGDPSRDSDIRDAALDLFVGCGYEATTMADIGAALGIRGPSLYKHVTSKREFLASIITETMDRLLDAHRAAIAHTDDPIEQLRRDRSPRAIPRPLSAGGVRR